ncbi:flagellar export protein FliJ [Helicobacter cetorum]|uniref:flagellar export protein FliJ n=1 Tax=Helicobacter cetorum TaxID=138563 RepID=UPI000CF06068|nr:flagellar export protein FliJ [Helicobacter cetorum]
MKKFASVLVKLKTLELEKIEQKLLEKRQVFLQVEKKFLTCQQDLSAFNSPSFGSVGLFLQTEHLKSALRVEIIAIKMDLDNMTKEINALEKDYIIANQELEKAKFLLENEVKKAQKILEKKEQTLLDENALILHFTKKSAYV